MPEPTKIAIPVPSEDPTKKAKEAAKNDLKSKPGAKEENELVCNSHTSMLFICN